MPYQNEFFNYFISIDKEENNNPTETMISFAVLWEKFENVPSRSFCLLGHLNSTIFPEKNHKFVLVYNIYIYIYDT